MALIGPSSYLLDENKGYMIDSFDVVVRLNASFTIKEKYHKYYGERTDILYHSLRPDIFPTKKDIAKWKDMGLKWIIFKSAHKSKRVKKYKSNIGDVIPWLSAIKIVESLKKKINKHPYIGITAITHILLADIKSLNIYGFDFNNKSYVPSYCGLENQDELIKVRNISFNSDTHDRASQIKFLNETWKTDSRLKIDHVLENVLKEVED